MNRQAPETKSCTFALTQPRQISTRLEKNDEFQNFSENSRTDIERTGEITTDLRLSGMESDGETALAHHLSVLWNADENDEERFQAEGEFICIYLLEQTND